MTFDKNTGILTWSGFGTWQATTGPYGRGALSSGSYIVSRREITAYTKAIKKGFRDKTGKGFFIPIYPKFSTTRGSNGRLGIHPDGNIPGTSGCIGLKGHSTRSFYDAVSSTTPSAVILLEVQ